MATPSPEKLRTDRKSVIGELVKGRDSATQLQTLLQKPLENHGSAAVEELVMKILGSFSESISVLMNSCESVQVFQIPAAAHVGSACSDDRTTEESGQSSKRPAVPDRRGCYKRRKTSDSRIKISPTVEDGYAWRKYGQKEILNAKHPRCYFRCTHKNDQGCKANKQVQRMENDPKMFHITYFGNHTCMNMNMNRATQVFSSDPNEVLNNSCILSFESKDQLNKNDHHPSCSLTINTNAAAAAATATATATVIKEEEVSTKAQSTDDQQSEIVSSGKSSLWEHIILMESSHDHQAPILRGFDHEDSCASTSSDHGLDMDILFSSVNFESDLQFDEMVEFSN